MRVRHLWSGLSVACAAALIERDGALRSSGQSAPRTPWGDPDIQGTYTNTYENGTPLERPDEFAGRKLDDVKGEELANMRRAIQKRTIGAFRGPDARARQLVAGQSRSRSRQPGVARRRSARRQDSAMTPEAQKTDRRRAPRLARRARAGRPTRTKIAVSTTAASRAACRVR